MVSNSTWWYVAQNGVVLVSERHCAGFLLLCLRKRIDETNKMMTGGKRGGRGILEMRRFVAAVQVCVVMYGRLLQALSDRQFDEFTDLLRAISISRQTIKAAMVSATVGTCLRLFRGDT